MKKRLLKRRRSTKGEEDRSSTAINRPKQKRLRKSNPQRRGVDPRPTRLIKSKRSDGQRNKNQTNGGWYSYTHPIRKPSTQRSKQHHRQGDGEDHHSYLRWRKSQNILEKERNNKGMGGSHPKGEEACTERGDEETSSEKAEIH